MSGHSKWSTIKHKKSSLDQRRGAEFSRISREITTAVREGKSGDPEQNPRLRSVLIKARSANMPGDNISRAILRGLGPQAEQVLEEVIYEGYGPHGIAVIAIARTDNRQRTLSLVKHAFEQAGGNLASPGSAGFLFERQDGEFTAKVRLPLQEEQLAALNRLVQALTSQEDVVAVYSNADSTGHE